MRYLTHAFAHSETLDRARRWLIHAGVAPEKIRVHHHGIPTLIVSAELAELDGLKMIIHAAETTDPDGAPGTWDFDRLPHPNDRAPADVTSAAAAPVATPSFPLAWGTVDRAADDDLRSQIELQRNYRETRP